MREFTRRDLLRLGAGAAVAAATPQILTGCGREQAASPQTAASPTAGPSARVAAIRGTDLYAMTREALEAVGGIQKVVSPGETVFIKPNMTTLPFAAATANPFLAGECTKAEILIAVAEECLRAGAAEVIIGDGSQMPTFDWQRATTLDGSTNLAAAAESLSSKYDGKVTLACLEVDSPEWVEVATSTGLGKIAVSSLVATADHVISIPVIKTHAWAQLTLSLKNFVGVMPLERYGWTPTGFPGRVLLDHSSPEQIAQVYLDIVDAVKPDLAIIDASIGVEGDGPIVLSSLGGEASTVDMRDRLGSWLLLASTDLVAADATAARVMSHDPAEVRQLVMGYEMALGEMREQSIAVVGERLDNLRVEWLPAELANARSPGGSRHGPRGHAVRRQMAHP